MSGDGYTKAVDWWSFGTLMYEMLVGKAPFSTDDPQMVFSKIMFAPIEIPPTITDADTRHMLSVLLDRGNFENFSENSKNFDINFSL